jgi:hypothetical protein
MQLRGAVKVQPFNYALYKAPHPHCYALPVACMVSCDVFTPVSLRYKPDLGLAIGCSTDQGPSPIPEKGVDTC